MSTRQRIKFKCEDCGAIFLDGEQYQEEYVNEPYTDNYELKTFEECPHCQSHEYYEYDEADSN